MPLCNRRDIVVIIAFIVCLTHVEIEASFREDLRLPKLLQFELPDKDEMCFYEDFATLNRSLNYELFYRVVSGGNNDVDVEVTDMSHKRVIYNKDKSTTDRFVFKTEVTGGPYKICFSNKFSTITHKRIVFSLHPTEPETLLEEAGKKRQTVAMTMMETALEKLHVYLTSVVDYQVAYRSRENAGRTLSEELNERVLFWSVMVTFMILLTGIGQVTILKNFFSDNRPVVPLKSDRV